MRKNHRLVSWLWELGNKSGQREYDSPTTSVSPGQKIGFFNQQYAEQLRMEETPTEYLQQAFNLPYQDARKCLGRFGLESHAHTIQICKLSGTQRAGEAVRSSVFISADRLQAGRKGARAWGASCACAHSQGLPAEESGGHRCDGPPFPLPQVGRKPELCLQSWPVGSPMSSSW